MLPLRSWKSDYMKILYYKDPLNDDFAFNHIQTTKVTESFTYIHKSLIWRFITFILYHLIALPLVYLYCKIIYGMRFKGRHNISKIKRGGFFLYGNHTHTVDSFIPYILSHPKRRNYIIASPDAVSIPGLRAIVMMLGAIPLPTSIKAMNKFLAAVKKRISSGATVTIYPEAHIWPYYTGIRPFTEKSFYYPVKMNVPVIAFCNTYTQRKYLTFVKVPRMKVYISEPFYPNPSLPPKEAQSELRDRVYQFMKQTADRNSNYEYIKYVQVKSDKDNNL
jgi:1-acyl-sn-glycerol-3-phosphate acyltransferase